jgi:hypothetical protein
MDLKLKVAGKTATKNNMVMDGQIFEWFTELLRELDLKVVEKACNNAVPVGQLPRDSGRCADPAQAGPGHQSRVAQLPGPQRVERLENTSEGLVQDMKFAADLATSCKTKTDEWKEQKEIRSEEARGGGRADLKESERAGELDMWSSMSSSRP